jgi:hypothetical protein
MIRDDSVLWFLVACVLILFATLLVLLRVRDEARETRAYLDGMESLLGRRFEQLEAQSAELHIKHFGLFEVRRPPQKAGEGQTAIGW